MHLRAPGLAPPGALIEAPVALYDLAPTVLDLAGLPPFEGRRGRSLRPAWEAPQTWEQPPILMDLLLSKGGEVLAWRDGSTKLHWLPGPRRGQLFDLARDPGERAPRTLDELTSPPALRRMLAAVAEARSKGGLAQPMQEGAAMSAALRALGYTEGGEEAGAESGAEAAEPR
jgi:arylsulfatase A-like enzyme